MILEAIYLHEHFLTNTPFIINFGGPHIYSINDKAEILRRKNEEYIENFYSKEIVKHISALVGKNGVGKSSILKEVAELYHGNHLTSRNIAFFSDGPKAYVLNPGNVKLKFKIEKKPQKVSFPKTLFYSPFLDFKDPIPGIDLSYDSFVRKDLRQIESIQSNGERTDPYRRLKTQNQVRLFKFLNSELGEQTQSFFSLKKDELFDVTTNTIQSFINYKEGDLSFHNTPENFRKPIRTIYKRIEEEREELRDSDSASTRSNNQFQKDFMKLQFLEEVLRALISMMESQNFFLEEGVIENEIDLNENSFNILSSFLEEHRIKLGNEKQSRLPISETLNLITKYNELIDREETEFDYRFSYEDRKVTVNSGLLDELVIAQEDFINTLEAYFKMGKFMGSDPTKIPDLINIEFHRKLSSGELGILNLFSKLYLYFEDEYSYEQGLFRDILVILDEPELGFHPEWKRKFVSTAIEFFEFLGHQKSAHFQILITTHDPLTLSDLGPSVSYLYQQDGVLKVNSIEDNPKSFGANLYNLLNDGFYLEKGAIGEFARRNIQILINTLTPDYNGSEIFDESEELLLKRINILSEPFLREKLFEMFDFKFGKFNRIADLEKELERLKRSK